MYKIYIDSELFCDSSINDLVVMNPVVTLEANTAGQFTFTIPVTHPYYNNITRLTSVVEVYRENKMVFRGFVSGDEKDLWNNRAITCEGDLSYFNDSILRPHKYQGETVLSLLTAYINEHNSQVEERKKFTVGVVTVQDPNDYIYCFTNMNSTMQEIKEDLIDDLGGYLRVRYSSCQDLFSLVPFQVRTVHNNRAYAGLFNLKPNTAYTISLESPSGTGSTVYFGSLDRSVEGQGGTQTITTDSTGIVWIWILEGRTATENYLNGTYPIHLVEGTEAYGKTYLDYIREQDFPTASQIIELGVNLINYKSNIDDVDLCTRVIPLGSLLEEQTIEGLDTRLTIEGQPVSSTHLHTTDDYLQSTSAVNNFGIITKTITFDDVATASKLVTKGNKYLSQNQFENLVIEVSAVDLGLVDNNVNTWELLQEIRVKSAVHGLDSYFPLTKMVLNLANPENDTFTLGTKSKLKTSLTARATEVSDATKKIANSINEAAWLTQAKANALNMLLDETQGGYVVFEYDQNNEYIEAINICNNTSIESSTKRWIWCLNGLGYAYRNNTSQAWRGWDKETQTSDFCAMTANGQINANMILTGKLQSIEISNGTNGQFHVDSSGNMTASSATINGGTIISGDGVSSNTGLITLANGLLDMERKRSGRTYNMQLDPFGGLYFSIDGDTVGNFDWSHVEICSDVTGFLVNNTSNAEVAVLRAALYNNRAHGVLELRSANGTTNLTLNGRTGLASIETLYCSGDATINGDLTVNGAKDRRVKTKNYGDVLLNAYETPKPIFADEGHGVLNNEGMCYIYLDNIFIETIDTIHRYRVFLTKYAEGDIWVDKVEKIYFVVKGTPGMEFDWKIDCIQRDYNYANLERFERDKDDEEPTDYVLLANDYLKKYEREVLEV